MCPFKIGFFNVLNQVFEVAFPVFIPHGVVVWNSHLNKPVGMRDFMSVKDFLGGFESEVCASEAEWFFL